MCLQCVIMTGGARLTQTCTNAMSSETSSAPLTEVRVRQKKQKQLGACMKATGLFDVQLLPNIYAEHEDSLEVSRLFCYIAKEKGAHCPRALPFAFVDDSTEHSFKKSMLLVQKLYHDVHVDYGNHSCTGFLRGLDPKHLHWRFEDRLLRCSADLPLAAGSLKCIFTAFNELCSPCTFAPLPTSARLSVLETFHAFVHGHKFPRVAFAASEVVVVFRLYMFKHEADLAPRCVVYYYMQLCGHSSDALALWPDPSPELYVNEVDAFTVFFRTPRASCTDRRVVSLKRGGRWRRTLKREDGLRIPMQFSSVLGTEWADCVRNGTRTVVLNAFMASVNLKRLVVKLLGDGSLSLGTVATERCWFQDHLRNLNRTGIWSTHAARRYRAVVAWKQILRTQLRRLLVHQPRTALLHETLESLLGENLFDRSKPLLSMAGVPRPLTFSELNGGYGRFCHEMGEYEEWTV